MKINMSDLRKKISYLLKLFIRNLHKLITKLLQDYEHKELNVRQNYIQIYHKVAAVIKKILYTCTVDEPCKTVLLLVFICSLILWGALPSGRGILSMGEASSS